MALSFEESLKRAKEAAAKKAAQLEAEAAAAVPAAASIASPAEDMGIATLEIVPEDGTIAAYAGDDWELSDKYLYYPEYYDDKMSIVDENKNIAVADGQINLTQEKNSQFVPFEMSRFYDGFDLMNATVLIYFENASGGGGYANPINLYSSQDRIKFGWLIDDRATVVPGKLYFEIHAVGVNSRGDEYIWKTKPNDSLEVLRSLSGEGVIEPDTTWVSGFMTQIMEQVSLAQGYANSAAEAVAAVQGYTSDAESAVAEAQAIVDSAAADLEASVESAVNAKVEEALVGYYTAEQVDELIAGVDVSDQLNALKEELQGEIDSIDGLAAFGVEYDGAVMTFYNGETVMKAIPINSDPTAEWTAAYTETVDAKISAGDTAVSDALSAYKDATDADLASLHEDIDGLPETLQNDYYNKEASDERFAEKAAVSEAVTRLNSVEAVANTNKGGLDAATEKLLELDEEVASIDKSPRLTYNIDYNNEEDPEVGKDNLAFFEYENEGQENEVRTLKKRVPIVGGSGGTGSSSVLKIEYVTKSPYVVTVNDKAEISFLFSGVDSSGIEVQEGTYTLKVDNVAVASGMVIAGENTIEITDFLRLGSQKVLLSVVDDNNTLATRSWTVQKIDVKMESSFNDTITYSGNVSFSYTPFGAIAKTIHFRLDGEELEPVTTSASGIQMGYTIPAQPHGAHLFEVWAVADVSGNTITSNCIAKDILFWDDSSSVPVIGCIMQDFTARQYDTVQIPYVVYDPNAEMPKVTLAVDGKVVSELTLETTAQTWAFKSADAGEHTLTITCGETIKTLKVVVEELDIDIEPVTAGLAFDFNPVGYSNNDTAGRLWSDGDVSMTVSDNFDWVNGGYHTDENGGQYFCVKAGTRAVIYYNLFADDPKKVGKEFKVVFATKNIRKRDTSFLTCMNDNIGLDMKVENATVYNTGNSLKSNYCEDAVIEYEFNINKDTDMMIVMSYEDGTPSTPNEYTSTASFRQSSPQPITIGSDDCDVYIYRMKAYSTSLTDTDIKNNFIADAFSADEMIARYNRNQIYNENSALVSTSANGGFSADALMKAAPDLRYIFLEVPQFTNDKDNKIDGCTVYFRYPAGKRPQDNWTCTGMRHRGQGTSSNLYGDAARNIDLCMDRSSSLFTWTDENGNTVESSTITLTDTSVPTNYLNVKVNVASSENANNAQLARRFNTYQPFLRYARKKDSRVKDTMEFYNCVVFIRETSTDSSVPHREFNDNNWHFYAIGNVGDSKKTDSTRVNNPNDPLEHVIEIVDVDKPLSGFPTGKDGHAICTAEEWSAGNSAYDVLHSTEYVYDEEGAFVSFGGETYEFRYEMEDITEEQREVNINAWRELYRFLVTSTDEEFHGHLKDYFVVDSALYYYLFTERYTMVDNRAKNSFWHYGKVYISAAEAAALGETEASYYIIDDEAAAIHNGYRYDLTFAYDMDTALGIDNTGDFVFPYGKEDTDYYVDGDPTSDYVFRVADSTFFCRLRDLFPSEMQAMFKNREERGAWLSQSLIDEWDKSQAQFPEELWRLDYERKYYRTYRGISIDNSIPKLDKTFLIGKFFGRKKYARRAFEPNNEIYFATKYFGNKALEDVFWIRGNVPIGSSMVPNYSLTLVPYSDMYVCVQYGSNGTPIHQKMKAGQICYFESTADRMDFIYVYAASYIQEVGDLSRCYIGDNSFTAATRLQKLVIGSTDEGYENTFMTKVLVENNPLLEYLDVRNVSGINTEIDVSGCGNLKELYAEGTNASGVLFANGGLLRVAHLPKIGSLSAKNLHFIEDFTIEGYDNLHTLVVENTPAINTYEIVNASPLLRSVRLVGLNWDASYQITESSVFNKLLLLGGMDSSGHETDTSVLVGNAFITVLYQQELNDYNRTWPELMISCDTLVEQYVVTFVNDDGSVLRTQYVVKGEIAGDPGIVPMKKSTVSHDFAFDRWDSDPATVQIFADKTFTATYTSSLRKYTIKHVVMGTVVQERTATYGSNVLYEGSTPVYTAQESAYAYHLFNRWDKSGIVDGDKVITAIFDKYEYDGNLSHVDFSDMTPVQIYALTKLYKSGVISLPSEGYIEEGSSMTFQLGGDIDYDDIEQYEIITDPVVFDGSNYVDTGISLFDVDRDFVLAVDYEFSSACAVGGVLMQCLQPITLQGVKLSYNENPRITWNQQVNTSLSAADKREVLVFRHLAGSDVLTVYNSNISGEIATISLGSVGTSGTFANTLIFGAAKANDGVYENYGSGTVYWAKVWYTDLGETACRTLASWIHEDLTMEICSFRKYALADDAAQNCSFTLLAANLLSLTTRWNDTNTTVGGFAESKIRSILNNRVYYAIPEQIRMLLKNVVVPSTVGGNSSEISRSSCYIYAPSYAELFNITAEPYINEGVGISYITGTTARRRADNNGVYQSYWTRSPRIYGTGTNAYVWAVGTAGDTLSTSNSYATRENYLLIQFSM